MAEPTWQERVAREADDLRLRLDRLNAWLARSDAEQIVGRQQILLLVEQRAFMRGYLDTLERRLLA